MRKPAVYHMKASKLARASYNPLARQTVARHFDPGTVAPRQCSQPLVAALCHRKRVYAQYVVHELGLPAADCKTTLTSAPRNVHLVGGTCEWSKKCTLAVGLIATLSMRPCSITKIGARKLHYLSLVAAVMSLLDKYERKIANGFSQRCVNFCA